MRIPLLPVQTVLFPGALMPVRVGEGPGRRAIQRAIDRDEPFGVVLFEPAEFGADLASVGSLAHIQKHATHDDGTLDAIAIGGERFRVLGIVEDDPVLLADVELVADEPVDLGDLDAQGSVTRLVERFRRYAQLALPVALGAGEIQLPPGPIERVNLICSALLVAQRQKQVLLEESNLLRRAAVASAILQRETLELDAHRAALRILRDEVERPGPFPFSRN